MWPFKRKSESPNLAPIFLTNTLSGKREGFAPLRAGVVHLYSCGPTVYQAAHIGNLRAYVFSDVLARTLSNAGLHVRRVINITDVGHLVGDAEEGEDKMAVSAKKEQVRPEEIATRYADLFTSDIGKLGIVTHDILFPKATEYIKEQIAMVQVLEARGHTYRLKDGVYFDTSTFPDYGKLGGVPSEVLKNGTAETLATRADLATRGRIKQNEEKRNAADFALWRTAKPNDLQQWSSPWGLGNPGWHIECSAMIKALLGETIDIHTGGMDHIPIHHNNEIAQSEAANNRPLARYWMHGAFLTVGGDKISKSLSNDVYLSDITERGLHPLSLRYFFLQAHYRTLLSFSWEALEASNEGLHHLWKTVEEVRRDAKDVSQSSEASRRIVAILREDLSTPQALAYLWECLKDDELSAREAWGVVLAAEPILGLSLTNPPVRTLPFLASEIPSEVQLLLIARDAARKARNYHESDRIRGELENRGYRVDDGPKGTVLSPGAR